jgi:hypothetical protein
MKLQKLSQGMFRQGISRYINSEKDCEKGLSIHVYVSVD